MKSFVESASALFGSLKEKFDKFEVSKEEPASKAARLGAEAAFAKAAGEWGRIDALFNNAGISLLSKTVDTITDDEWLSLVAPLRARRPASVQHAVGCDECRHTGYRGRIAIYEMLRMSGPVRELIGTGVGADAIRDTAIAQGMRPLRIAGAKKVQQGLTTPAEVISVVQEGESG